MGILGQYTFSTLCKSASAITIYFYIISDPSSNVNKSENLILCYLESFFHKPVDRQANNAIEDILSLVVAIRKKSYFKLISRSCEAC